MADLRDDTVDRLLAGDLSPGEQRRLAQAALDDEALFDRVMAAAAAQSALIDRVAQPAQRQNASAFRAAPRSRHFGRGAVLALAAAAVLVLSVAIMRPRTGRGPVLEQAASSQQAAIPAPVLLPVRDAVQQSAFRSADSRNRTPKQVGTITAVGDGVVDVDIGALDGVVKDVDLPVTTSGNATKSTARIAITTVFRERSRGRIITGAAHAGDRVEIDAARFAAALLDEADAQRLSGGAEAARTLVQSALDQVTRADTAVSLRRRALGMLGTLDQQLQDWPAAERALAAAADLFDTTPAALPDERAQVLNALAVSRIEQRNLDAAERALRTAATVASGRSKLHVTNNLGAVAALRGKRTEAESWYRQAQLLAGSAPASAADRSAIDANLHALSSGH